MVQISIRFYLGVDVGIIGTVIGTYVRLDRKGIGKAACCFAATLSFVGSTYLVFGFVYQFRSFGLRLFLKVNLVELHNL